MEFSEVLKELRESHNLTQDQLAKQIDVSRSTIAGYESRNRQPDYEKLINISKYFHVSIDYLLTGQKEIEFSALPLPEPNEKILDRKVIKAYRRLGFASKQDVLKYIELLELKENHHKM